MVTESKNEDSSTPAVLAKRIFFPLNESLTHKRVYRSACILVQTLRSAGFEALFVGGFVRKLVLEKVLGEYASIDKLSSGSADAELDIDIATSADPATVKKLFRNSHFVGQVFGVSMVDSGHHTFEVASFRTEGPYSDGRRPDHVSLGTLYQDSCRRDFSINALYFDPETSEVIDFHGGVDDAQDLVLRTVGKPADRFSEDKLRIFRMCRFAANNGLKIDALTWQAAQDLAQSALSVSRERVILELNKTDTSALPRFLVYCSLLGLDLLFCKVKFDLEGEFFRKLCSREHRFEFPVSLLLLSGWSFFLRISTSEKLEVMRQLVSWPTTVNDRKVLKNLYFFGETFRFINAETELESDERSFVHSAMLLNLLRKVSIFTFSEIRSLIQTMRATEFELSPFNAQLFEELLKQLLLVTHKHEDDGISESFIVFDRHDFSKGRERKHLWRSSVITNLQKHKIQAKYFAAFLVFADLVILLPANSFGLATENLFISLEQQGQGEFELDETLKQALDLLVSLEKKLKWPSFE